MFVGRDRQISSLAEAYFDARAGAGRVVLVGGDAGIGKSRLVREFATRVRVPLVTGASPPVAGEDIPFAPIGDLLRTVRRDQTLARRIRQDRATAGLVPLAPELWGEPRSGVRGPDATAVFESVLAMLATLSVEGPLVVLLEDLHWADPATWDLLAFLSRALTDERVVVVATYRDDEVTAASDQRRMLADLIRSDKVRRILLGPLDPDDVAAQVSALCGPVSSARLQDIVRRSAGNPLFVEALTAGDGPDGAVPAALDDLLAARMARLPAQTRAVLRAMGVIGRQTVHELLAAAVQLPDEDLEAALRPALDQRLVVVVPDEDAYALRHPLWADAAAADAMPSERRRLHGRIADALAADPRLAVTPAGLHGERAAHLLGARRLAEALREYMAAANVSMLVAPGAAHRQLEQALDLWSRVDAAERPSETDHVDVLWDAAEMAEISGLGQRAIELAEHALASDPRPTSATRLERLGRYLWAGNRIEESEAAYRRAAAAIPDGDRSLDTARTLAGLAQAAYLSCRYAQAAEHCRAALAVATAVGEAASWVTIHASRVLGAVLSERGLDEEAVALCRQAHQRALADSDPERHLAAIYLVMVLANAGRDDEAVPLALDAMADAQRAGVSTSFGMYLAAMAAECMIHVGRWDEADTLLRLQPAADDAIPVTALRLRLAQAWLAGRRGDHDTAASLLDRCESMDADVYHRLLTVFRRGEAALDRGDWATAAASAMRGRAVVTSENASVSVRLLWVDIASQVELLLDALARRENVDAGVERDRLLAEIAILRRQLTDIGVSRSSEAFLQLAAAEAHRLTPVGSAERWAEVAHTWTSLQRPWRAAQARLRQAEAAVDAGDVGTAQLALRSAHAVAGDLRAEPLTTAVERLAARTRLRLEAAPAAAGTDSGPAPSLGLTSREAEVLSLVSLGYSNREIGERLFVSGKTVSVHVSNILRKLGVTTRVEAAAVAQRLAG